MPPQPKRLTCASTLQRYHVELVRHSGELGERGGLHLAHHVASVHLHRDFADADVAGDLLVETAPHDLHHDLALAGAERREALRGLELLAGAASEYIASRSGKESKTA